MKRRLLICLSCLLLILLVACGKSNPNQNTSNQNSSNQSNVTVNDTVTDDTQSDVVEPSSELKEDTTSEDEKQEDVVSDIPSDSLVGDNSSETTVIEPTPEEIEDDPNQSEIEVSPTDPTPDSDADVYVGEYNDYDTDEPRLEIKKNEDDTYKIQIGIFRLIQLDNCVGKLTEKGLEFSTTELGDKDISGIITLEGDIATVKFTGSGWSEYSGTDEYKYYKTSDTPNIYEY